MYVYVSVNLYQKLYSVHLRISSGYLFQNAGFVSDCRPRYFIRTPKTSSPSSFHENVGTTLEVTPPSPSTTSISSFESAEDFTDDPDWVPVSVHGVSSHGCEKVTGGRKRAAKPYARVGTEEKKLRKKEQNKNAATRYRQKKKAEVEEILSEEKQLADANEELQTKVNDLSREIKYLKGLMRDVFKAKGLLK